MLEKVSGSKQNNCENCHKEQGTGYCKQCSKFLCQTCVDMHNKWGDFASHQILEMDDVTTTASKLVPLREQPTMECSSHGEPMKVYCDTCDKLVCHLCTAGKVHRYHDYEPIIDYFPRHQLQLVDNLQKVNQKLGIINTAVKAMETQEEDFVGQVGAARKEIEAMVHQLIQLLRESEKNLMRELDQVSDAYIQQISVRKKEADITITQLKTCKEYVENELRIGSHQEILVMKRQMIERMAAVCSLDNLQPVKETKVRFAKSASVLQACRSLGSVVRYGQFAVAGDKTSFDLSSAAPFSSKQVSCHLSPAADPTLVVRCIVHQVSPGSFEVRYSPASAGLHQLRVQVGGTDVLDTPLNVEVIPRKPRQTFTDLSTPRGLAIVRNGNLIVAERNMDCITIIDSTTNMTIRKVGELGSKQEQFKYPRGVAVTQNDRVIVSDFGNHRLQVLTAEGAFIATVGTKGLRPLQFDRPMDVAVHCSGRIYVSECGNNRVQVLNADLGYSHCFGTKGAQPGELNHPRGIAVDVDGMVYVSDTYNDRVQKFTPEGKLLAVIKNKGEGRGQLNRPYGLCVDASGILYVTEHNRNTVCMFNQQGQFLGYVGDSDGSSFKDPAFILSDQTGQLYISDDNGVTLY